MSGLYRSSIWDDVVLLLSGRRSTEEIASLLNRPIAEIRARQLRLVNRVIVTRLLPLCDVAEILNLDNKLLLRELNLPRSFLPRDERNYNGDIDEEDSAEIELEDSTNNNVDSSEDDSDWGDQNQNEDKDEDEDDDDGISDDAQTDYYNFSWENAPDQQKDGVFIVV